MSLTSAASDNLPAPIAVDTMRTLLVCRGPIAFETLEIYRRCHWQVPHVVVSSREWIAELQRTAPWIADLPPEHVHYVQEYNDIEAILAIARQQHIDAIYPGYGFLAESADFAARVEAAGLRFIGPTPETLRAVGDKDTAIQLAKRLGIPTIPGDDTLVALARTHRQDQTAAETVRRLLEMARQYPGYPIRLKHPAGGGGKGQRVLGAQELLAPDASEAILDALAKLWAEMGVSAAAADAQKGVLIELNIPRPLHWEVQLFGDGKTVVHFAARDCSLQNHGYQKFIELALHPAAIAQEMRHLDPHRDAKRLASLQQRHATLERICNEALRLGQAVHLRGAATVEFLIDEQGLPYFLEVNPRIQVEHGVTEGIACVGGRPVSLVELQQRVAAGEKLTFQQSDITCVGDAIEIRLNAPPALHSRVRIDAGGLLQRHTPWIIPSYDANFALIIVSGTDRHDTLDGLLTTLETALHVEGNTALHTNLHPITGLLTLMRALPPETAFRTHTSLVWTALTAIVEAQKHTALAALPGFPRRLDAYDPARFARLLRATLEARFAHPSRLLTYYLKRLTSPGIRPLTPLEVLWDLAEELSVPLFAEEQQQGTALRQAIDTLWATLSATGVALPPLLLATVTQGLDSHPDFARLCQHLAATTADIAVEECAELLRDVLAWCSTNVPAITALIHMLESTQLHLLLTVNHDLSVTPPAYLEDDTMLMHLHRLLSKSLRPAMLRHGELLSPMEATIYHQPEPGAPPFVEVGAEIAVGQTLALLEAMKMFTELPSPVDGVLVDILVENGQGVKTGAPLFKIATQEVAIETADNILHGVVDTAFQNRFGLLLPEETPA